MYLKGDAVKIMATAKHDIQISARKNGEFELVDILAGSEYQVTKVTIGAYSTSVEVAPKHYDKLGKFNSVDFLYELVLGASRRLRERRVEIDIIDDLLRDSLIWPFERWIYSDDMPEVTTDYVIVPA